MRFPFVQNQPTFVFDSTRGPGLAGHWERYWTETDEVSAMLGGVKQRDALLRHWETYFAAQAVPGGPVLEIASGAAPILKPLAGLPSSILVCADLSEKAVAVARCSMPALNGVVCDGAALPFRPGAFAMVLSQFGVEYSGSGGFRAAAEMLAPEGRLALVTHIKGGAIYLESSENANALALAEASQVFKRMAAVLRAAYAQEPASPAAQADLDKALSASAAALRERLSAARPSSARSLLLNYLEDMAKVASRRRAFAPTEAMGWLEAVSARLKDYRHRMDSMLSAAHDEDQAASVCETFSKQGLADITAEPLHLAGDPLPAAWWITARRPA